VTTELLASPPGVPALLWSSEKVTAAHRSRDAYVYVRQSTPSQVVAHAESLARQYELRERAVGLGWPARQVVVIDADLGRSGADATARLGFRELVADVGLGQVGIVLGIEVSRLARNNADWYQLLDLCALTDTLIADADGVYHPADFNDRLVLGLKGTMSEAELHLIRSRLTAGLKHKAARGQLRQGLPVGLDYDADDRVIITPDEAVREAIATVFRRFDELGSARQVLLSLREDGLLLPRRRNGCPRISWASATYPAIHDFLSNPAYAGAFVFGRTRTEKRIDPATGRVQTRVRVLPREQWEVLIPDHHSGFISWQVFEANTARLRANWRPPRGHGGGAPREGKALLQGLLRCGRCGRIMQTGYSGPAGNSPRYVCARAQQLYAGEHGCQSIGGGRLEKTVLAELFAVLEPAALSATAQALADADAHFRQRLTAFELAVERARFETDRALRQFDAVEPENRLVARTLEKTLEGKLATQRRAENDLATQRARRPVALSDAELAGIAGAGADVRAVFDAPSTTTVERKQLIRAVIAEIVLTVDAHARIAALRIIWQGGATTELTMAMTKKGGHTHTTSEYRGADTPPRPRLRRPDHRRDPGQTAAPHPNRAAVHPSPGGHPARQLRHPGPHTNCRCRAKRPRCRRGHHQRRGEDPRRLQGHPLSVAARRVHPRRADHPRRALADPHRPEAEGPDPIRGARRLATPRRGRRRAWSGPADGVAQGPTRPTQRGPCQPRPPQRAAYPGQTRSSWTVRHN
jgi:DNA invertase Pin-like site-specific DNA recombinase